MAGWLKGAVINTDSNLRLQYLAGLGLNEYESAAIYRGMIEETRYPEHLFEGSDRTLAELRTFIDRTLGASRPYFD
jgi:spermidine synthase